MAQLRRFELSGQGLQLVNGYGLFDQREHLALLEAHVGRQLRAELFERDRGGCWCRRQRVSAMADRRVIAECASAW